MLFKIKHGIISATSILAQKDKGKRAKLISDLIIIADELYKLNNFSSFIAIINALEGSAISRLHSSWNKVIVSILQVLQDILQKSMFIKEKILENRYVATEYYMNGRFID